ncbi:MAG: phenylpyruvate tautomerase PptA (4-oxalocrotonate tautomerase family) [Oceanospirillaceae bacterium]|jgi:phenylpyruvate tautomerase PptA (4-oxalocrotonate tautomerase family)
MPSVTIEVKKNYSVEEEISIMRAVYESLVTAFNITPNERTIRLIVHKPHRYMPDPNIDNPELHTHISIDTFTGRSIKSKRTLYKEMVINLEKLGIPRNHVEILIREIPRENWGIRGGKAGCDI